MDNNTSSELRKVQLTELEILKLIDKICRDNNIKYSLCGGTLLGAVRHKGYIPWDDDLDIAMRRSDYERFICVWNELRPEGYILQNKENSPEFPSTFSKIRKDHTTFLTWDWEKDCFILVFLLIYFLLTEYPKIQLKRLYIISED